MTPTRLSSALDSIVACWPPDAPATGPHTVAIHQPNLFPRLATLAKLWAADCWIVLDSVQFCRRDYQHRSRLAHLADPRRGRWLSIATRLPDGQSTLIRDARTADPLRCRRRVTHMLHDHYRTSRYWKPFRDQLEQFLPLFDTTDQLATIAEASTLLLLGMLGWPGQVLSSSGLPARSSRAQRIVDLAAAVGPDTYLSGTGGMKYLERDRFTASGIRLVAFQTPSDGVWANARQVSAVHALMQLGLEALADELCRVAAAQQEHTERWALETGCRTGIPAPSSLGKQQFLRPSAGSGPTPTGRLDRPSPALAGRLGASTPPPHSRASMISTSLDA